MRRRISFEPSCSCAFPSRHSERSLRREESEAAAADTAEVKSYGLPACRSRQLQRAGFAVAIVALTLAGAPGAFAAARPTVNQVSQGLTCQCGCGLTVANCNHPQCSFSVPLRGEIEAMISHGETRDQILAYYRHKFGEKILSAPTTEGFNLLAWTMPFAAILLGGGFITLAFTRWRKAPSPREKTPAPSEPTTFDADLRRRLENELKENR
jgi:cytochrome c-type biogenesis protein CcmH